MKLRIKGNSIRLRFTKTEVAEVSRGGSVRASVHFGGAQKLEYCIEGSEEINDLQAQFHQNRILILVPKSKLARWGSSDEIAMKSNQRLEGESELFILIEKDFVCLKPRMNENEDESDLFENPNFAHGSCG